MPAGRAAVSGSARENAARRRAACGLMERLRSRKDFLAAAGGSSVASSGFVVEEHRRGDDGPPRIGFTVSRRVGGAVERNRVRRRLKEIARLSASASFRTGSDYVVIGRSAALEMAYARLASDFAKALHRLERGWRSLKPRPGMVVPQRSSGDQSGT
jgi:ribonuclease P protein component